VKPPRSIALFTHRAPEETGEAVRRVLDAAQEANVEVRLPAREAEKHGVASEPGVTQTSGVPLDVDMAVVLGGDGTILEALRAYAGRDVPVFSFNYGAIGFLSTVEDGDLDFGLRCVFAGEFETLPMPALAIDAGGERRYAVNDISLHRRPDSRVAELAYSVQGETLGRVRCDGLVASTPVGSTGYNLANGGPVLAWGVEGFVVSFIAPHTLTARGLVVAIDDQLTVSNVAQHDPVDVTVDGRSVGELGPGQDLEVGFEHDRVLLAQIPGSTFYGRLREKFGRLAY